MAFLKGRLTIHYQDENFEIVGKRRLGETNRSIRTKELSDLEVESIYDDFQKITYCAVPRISYTEDRNEVSSLNDAAAQSSVDKAVRFRFQFEDGSVNSVSFGIDVHDNCFVADAGEGANAIKPLEQLEDALSSDEEKALARIINRFLPVLDADGNITGEQEFKLHNNNFGVKRYLGGERI